MMSLSFFFLDQKGKDLMNIIERLEHFKDFQKKLKMQDMIIREKKETLVKACQTHIPDLLRQKMFEEVERAEGKKNEILFDELRERQELEPYLMEVISDDKIRTVLILHYLHGKKLKEISAEMMLCYDYIRELCAEGRKILKQVA